MHDFAGRIEGAGTFSEGFFYQVLEDFSKHVRIDGDFLLKWLRFVYGEVVPVEHIKDPSAGVSFAVLLAVEEKLVRQDQRRRLPVVIAQRLKQTTVQKRDARFEPLAPGFWS